MPHEDNNLTNHGALIGRRAYDYIAGVIPYEVRNPSGNWSSFVGKLVKQFSSKTDTMGCVSFSGVKVCEIQIEQQTGVQVDLSPRFLAKMSNTTPEGNWLYIVADTIRNVGLVPESVWPIPPFEYTWSQFYEPIPQSVINKAAEFKQLYTIQTEWINPTAANIAYHLKHAPLQFVIPGHAIGGIAIKIENNVVTYVDTYSPFIKTINVSQLQDVYKILLTKKGYTMAKVLNDNGTIRLEFGSGPSGFNIGIASSSLFNQIVASGEPILKQPATTPEKLTISEGMIVHRK